MSQSSNNPDDYLVSNIDFGDVTIDLDYTGSNNTMVYSSSTTNTNPYAIGTTSGFNGTYTISNVGIDYSTPGLKVSGDADFEGDITIKGRSLTDMLDAINDRLAILHPDPAKLEKYRALKEAYEHYKMLERLIGDE